MTTPTHDEPHGARWPDDVRLALPPELRRLAEQLDDDGARHRDGAPAGLADRIARVSATGLDAGRAPAPVLFRFVRAPLRIAAAVALLAGGALIGWLAMRPGPQAPAGAGPVASHTGQLVDQELDVWLQPTSGWDTASLSDLADLNSSLASLHKSVSDFWTTADDAIAGESL